MGIQKKHGKGRLDKWYRLAKEKGYRARAAFKLIQLNKKYGFLERSKVLLDLCAAPGSWCQVAAESMPVDSLIVGVDLSPIKAIPRVITFQSDITTDKCRATIRQHFKTWKADTVLHDGAPNVGTAWVQDSFNQAELALQALRLATDFLTAGGTFVTKVFRSKDYNSLLWVFNQLFTKVEATKPPSSRNVSAEIFVVCQGFKAPKRIDPRFLDPKAVFAELSNPTPNNEAKVFNPEVKKRKRDGYEDGNYTQFKEVAASDFIQTTDPIAMLGELNRFTFVQPPNGDIALSALEQLPETTTEIRICCEDLRVLGRKEFRSLLRWRLKVRDIFGLAPKKTAEMVGEVAEIAPMDEELRIQEELQDMSMRVSSRKKRERRRENEKKQREIVRMQLHMTAPTEIGLEQAGPNGDGSMFALKLVDKSGAIREISRGQMLHPNSANNVDDDSGLGESESDLSSDDEGDRLDVEIDSMYSQYQERRSETDAKYRARRARQEFEDGEWEGFDAEGGIREERDESQREDDSDDNESLPDSEALPDTPLLNDLQPESTPSTGLSIRAAQFFDNEMFRGLETADKAALHDPTSKCDSDLRSTKFATMNAISQRDGGTHDIGADAQEDSDDEAFEIVRKPKTDDQWGDTEDLRSDGRPEVDIITAEAMTLAQQIASGERSRHDLIDEGFNKYAFKDRDGLPEWFLDDESKHDKPHRPISAAGAAAIKAKLRALNARPIKKVREAKDRKKFKAAQRLEKLRKKSALLNEEEGMTEKEKAQGIVKLMNKAAKKRPRQEVKVVVARGGNRGISGRPRGVKGKYKIVDARLKKDTRAEKRQSKKRK